MNNTSSPIVSVVVPMFNVGKYIKTCIESVLAQTFGHFEILCVDDGCTDNTLRELARFSDPRIRLIQQKNRGLSGARNTGIQHARGIYVALLDADDYWAPEKLSRHVEHLNSRPSVGVSYCPSMLVDEQGKPMNICQTPRLSGITKETVLCRNPVGNGSAPVIRKQLLLKMNRNAPGEERLMIFDESLRQSEDIELWVRIALETIWQFEGLAEPMTFYRVNNEGLSANVEKQYASWQKAIKQNWTTNGTFFKRFYSLAKAYQLRYLARRAVQSSDSLTALKLAHRALFTDMRMLRSEPGKTLVTLACAYLSLLPTPIYRWLSDTGMNVAGKIQRRRLSQAQQDLGVA